MNLVTEWSNRASTQKKIKEAKHNKAPTDSYMSVNSPTTVSMLAFFSRKFFYNRGMVVDSYYAPVNVANFPEHTNRSTSTQELFVL